MSNCNDFSFEALPHERYTNPVLHSCQLLLLIGFIFQVAWLIWFSLLFWTIFLISHIFFWWLPYFFGWPQFFLKNVIDGSEHAYHLLPARGNRPIPDLNHCIIGFPALAACISSWLTIIKQ